MKKTPPAIVRVRSALSRASAIRGGAGAGFHDDRRTKRSRTRSVQKRNAIQDQQ